MFHTDLSGSVIGETIGTVSQLTGGFAPFGPRQGPAPAQTLSNYGYTGHSADYDLALINMRGRVYDTVQRRFLTRDPVLDDPYAVGGTGPYTYVRNNPPNSTDPTGLQTLSGEGIAGIYGEIARTEGVGVAESRMQSAAMQQAAPQIQSYAGNIDMNNSMSGIGASMQQGRMGQSMSLAPGGFSGPTSMGEAGPQYSGNMGPSSFGDIGRQYGGASGVPSTNGSSGNNLATIPHMQCDAFCVATGGGLGPGSFITGGLRLAGPGLTLLQRALGRLGFGTAARGISSVPLLVRGSGGKMLGQAMGILKATPAAQRAVMAQQLLGQIQARATGGAWNAVEMAAAGGGRAWVGETHTLVVDAAGRVFSGAHVGGAAQFGLVEGQIGVTSWSGLKALF